MKTLTFFSLFIGLLLASQLQAQNVYSSKDATQDAKQDASQAQNVSSTADDGSKLFSMSILGLHSKPLGELAGKGYHKAYGLSLDLLSPDINISDPLKLQLGAHLDFAANNPSDKHTVLLTAPNGFTATHRMNNHSIGGHFIARLITPEARFRFYLDGIIGGRYIGSQETLHMLQEHPDYDTDTEEEISSDLTFIYGFSVGSLLRLSKDVNLEFRTTYSHGSRTEFVDLNSVSQPENEIKYNMSSVSSSPMLFFQLGINFKINSGSGNGYYHNDNDSYGRGGLFDGGGRGGRSSDCDSGSGGKSPSVGSDSGKNY